MDDETSKILRNDMIMAWKIVSEYFGYPRDMADEMFDETTYRRQRGRKGIRDRNVRS